MNTAGALAIGASLLATCLGAAGCVAGGGRTPALHSAIDSRDLVGLRRELARMPDLEPACRKNEICKPLSLAAENLDLDMVKALVEAGADVNGRNAYGDTAFITVELKAQGEADRAKVREIRRYLLEHGLNGDQSNDFGFTPLSLLAGAGDIELMDLAVRRGADINHQSTETGYSALMVAARLGQVEAMRWLLESGADASLRSRKGLTALETARVSKQLEAERFLAALP